MCDPNLCLTSPAWLRIYDPLNQKVGIQFVEYVLEKLPFRVEVIQTDIQTRLCPPGAWIDRPAA